MTYIQNTSINWGGRVTNPNGNKLQNYIIATQNTVFSLNKPTYFQ